MRVIGYVRVSTEEQGMSGAGLQAQRAAIIAECERRGWTLVEIAEDVGRSGKDLKRPGIRAALDMLAAGDASALVVAKLDRLSRSMLDFARHHDDRAEAVLGTRGAGRAGGHHHPVWRGDGAHARDVRPVRATADLRANEAGARSEAS